MKKLILIAAAFVATTAMSFGAITSSKHDFNGSYGLTEICAPCHVPHNASGGTYGYLWDHDVTAVASYTLYDSTTMANTAVQPDDTSKLCLSCHDGTVAVDSFGGTTGTNKILATSAAYIGTDLSNDHPINVDISTPASGYVAAATVDATLPLSGAGNTIVTCASCHDVHNGGTGAKLLRISNTGSALCLTCHQK